MIVAGQIIGRKYEILRLLGTGGMGQVFEARNLHTGRRVAIKVLLPAFAREPEVIQRFLREARAASCIRHPNVVDILDLDIDPHFGIPFIVQEYLNGECLKTFLARQPGRRVSAEVALSLIKPVLSAMAAAHQLGVIHRDLKPGNIFLARDANGGMTVKVIDFGIARFESAPGSRGNANRADPDLHTRTGVPIGTPAYMSPEQAAGDTDVDARTDVWAIGVVLYQLMTGRLPYQAANANLLIGKLLYETPTPITTWERSLPRPMIDLVSGAIHPDRAQRFRSASDMLATATRIIPHSTPGWSGNERGSGSGAVASEWLRRLRALSSQTTVPLFSTSRQVLVLASVVTLTLCTIALWLTLDRRSTSTAGNSTQAPITTSLPRRETASPHAQSSQPSTVALTDNSVAQAPAPAASVGTSLETTTEFPIETPPRLSPPPRPPLSLPPPRSARRLQPRAQQHPYDASSQPHPAGGTHRQVAFDWEYP